MVMGYRSTVQTVRGQSCFRQMWRMKKGDDAEKDKESDGAGWFERKMLPVARDNAALPTGLEVTVLHAPGVVDPDGIAKLVMGLRLGYAHYDDWTALPAPLFFVRKVQQALARRRKIEP